MKQLFFLTISIFSIALISAPLKGYCNSPITFHKNISKAKEISKNQSKLLLIYFKSSDNEACVELEENVFPDQEIASLLNAHYVAVSVEANNYDGKAIMAVYGQKTLPAIVAINQNDIMVGNQEGEISLIDLSSALRKWNYNAKGDPLIAKSSIITYAKNTNEIKSDHPENKRNETKKHSTVEKDNSLFNKYWEDDKKSEATEIKITETPEVQTSQEIYAIQLGAFGQYKNASELSEKIQTNAGIESNIVSFNKDGKSLHKVFAGNFFDKKSAQKGLNHVQSKGFTGFVTKTK